MIILHPLAANAPKTIAIYAWSEGHWWCWDFYYCRTRAISVARCSSFGARCGLFGAHFNLLAVAARDGDEAGDGTS